MGDLAETYVDNLINMVERHLSISHRFVCFCDDVNKYKKYDFVDYLPIPDFVMRWPRNMKKIYLYNPDNTIKGRVLYIDLDTIITGSIDDIAQYRGQFCGVKPSAEGRNHIGGGLLSFDKEKCQYIWDSVIKKSDLWASKSLGKERTILTRVIKKYDYWQDLFPSQYKDYKKDIRNRLSLPDDVRVIAFRGTSRPHKVDIKWAKNNWANQSTGEKDGRL